MARDIAQMMSDCKTDFVVAFRALSIPKADYKIIQLKSHEEISLDPKAMMRKSMKLTCNVTQIMSNCETDCVIVFETLIIPKISYNLA